MNRRHLLSRALTIMFAILTTTLVLSDFGNTVLVNEQRKILGGDLRIRAPMPINELLDSERFSRPKHTDWITFNTMISANQTYVLVTANAVDAHYPLYGELKIDFGDGAMPTRYGPKPNAIWIPKRLGERLKVNLGDTVSLANQKYRVQGWLLETPTLADGFQNFFPRVLMHIASFDHSILKRPGARPYFYRAYALSDTGLAQALTEAVEQLKNPLIQVQRANEDNTRRQRTIDNILRFITTFLTIGVGFAVIAVTLAAHDYASRSERSIALLKAIGATRRYALAKIIRTWPWMLCKSFFLGALIGLTLALVAFVMTKKFVPGMTVDTEGIIKLMTANVLKALVVGSVFFVAILTPFLWRVIQVPTWKILTSLQKQTPPALKFSLAIGTFLVGAFIWLFADSASLSIIWLLIIALWSGIWSLIFGLFNRLLIKISSPSSILGIASRRLQQTRWQTLLTSGIAGLLTSIFIAVGAISTELTREWAQSLEQNLPNHFLLDILPEDKDALGTFLQNNGVKDFQFYPIFRARLDTINDVPATARERERVGALHRPLNLTFSETLPPDNRITQGDWNTAGDEQMPAISIAASLASRLNIKLGDVLGFKTADYAFSGVVTSIRKVEWDNLRPNFFVIFRTKPSIIGNDFTYITAFHLPKQRRALTNTIADKWPTIIVLDLNNILAQFQEILVTGRVLVNSLIAMVAIMAVLLFTIINDLTEKLHLHWATIARVFGATRRQILQIMLTQILTLSIITGLLSMLFGWGTYSAAAKFVFKIDYQFPALSWFSAPLFVSVLLAILLLAKLYPISQKTTIQLLLRRD